MKSQERQPEFISAIDLSKLLNISISKVYILCKENKIPHYQIGSQKRFKTVEIYQWISQNQKIQRIS